LAVAKTLGSDVVATSGQKGICPWLPAICALRDDVLYEEIEEFWVIDVSRDGAFLPSPNARLGQKGMPRAAQSQRNPG
jgi:hypothetical protein